MPEQPSLGDQELEVLRFIADHGPLSVGEAARRFGESRGLARTTILTMMERLRKKGYLGRTKSNGAFQYACRAPKSELLRGLVQEFVEKTLDGSLSPFVAYLADAKGLSDEELAELKRQVDEMTLRRNE
jgi:predicted transcriptional regulator